MSEINLTTPRSDENEKVAIERLHISMGFEDMDNYSPLNTEVENKKGLTTFEATQTLISCIIGCVLVSVPYSMTMTGYLNGIIINFLVLSIIMFATHLYLQASEIFKIR